ncbi:hypothetical protein Agub_g4004 [Astrephomene gubernaculifera]|uniref:Uncharacterized protein n=1 Tax=Astrephomene gubernaculifera TaxID=47775 RepID=A0AAD3DJJ2_9CHLO|nr:hypothetical protein Agub_g4004 [Astrephomene gubernaculifera]
MAPTPFPTNEGAAPGASQDVILIVILLGVMLFFLIRNIGKFSSSGMKVSRASRKARESADETTTAGEEEEEEEEEDEGAETKED